MGTGKKFLRAVDLEDWLRACWFGGWVMGWCKYCLTLRVGERRGSIIDLAVQSMEQGRAQVNCGP